MPGMSGKVRAQISIPDLTGWRLYRNFTQLALSEKSGMTATMISRIENDPARLVRQSTLEKLASALEVTTQVLRTQPAPEHVGKIHSV